MAIPVSIYSGRIEQIDDTSVKLMKIWYQCAVGAGSIAGQVGAGGASNLPYGADEQILTNVVGGPGPTVIVYKKAGATIKTRTLTYSGAAASDVLLHTVDT